MKNMGYSGLVNKKEDSLRGPEEPCSPDRTTHSQEDDLNLHPTNRIMILEVHAHRKHLGHLLTKSKSIWGKAQKSALLTDGLGHRSYSEFSLFVRIG